MFPEQQKCPKSSGWPRIRPRTTQGQLAVLPIEPVAGGSGLLPLPKIRTPAGLGFLPCAGLAVADIEMAADLKPLAYVSRLMRELSSGWDPLAHARLRPNKTR